MPIKYRFFSVTYESHRNTLLAGCRVTECRVTECRVTECRVTECRVTECRVTECPKNNFLH